jgi:RHS repeat-associated protein
LLLFPAIKKVNFMDFFHTATNSVNTVFENNSFSTSKKQTSNYNAWGDTQRGAGEFTLGYNGERRDPLTGVTHLGNGYRAYNPVLMRFNAPDSWSPFGDGGLNCYAYCEGDPVNRIDPNGHSHQWAIAGIALSVIGMVGAVVSGGMSVIAATGAKAVAKAVGLAVVTSIPTFVTGAISIVGADIAKEKDQEAKENAPYELIGPEKAFGQKAAMFGLASAITGVVKLGFSARRLHKSRLPQSKKSSRLGSANSKGVDVATNTPVDGGTQTSPTPSRKSSVAQSSHSNTAQVEVHRSPSSSSSSSSSSRNGSAISDVNNGTTGTTGTTGTNREGSLASNNLDLDLFANGNNQTTQAHNTAPVHYTVKLSDNFVRSQRQVVIPGQKNSVF